MRSRHYYCLYTQIDDRGGIYIVIYVDDLLIVGDRMDLVKQIKLALSNKLQMTDCGSINHFLGIKIRYDREAGSMYEKQCFLPVQPENVVTHPYRELLGSLMYIMLSFRPDICYAVGYLGRFQNQPGQAHWQALKRVVRYLKGTNKLQLHYKLLTMMSNL